MGRPGRRGGREGGGRVVSSRPVEGCLFVFASGICGRVGFSSLCYLLSVVREREGGKGEGGGEKEGLGGKVPKGTKQKL